MDEVKDLEMRTVVNGLEIVTGRSIYAESFYPNRNDNELPEGVLDHDYVTLVASKSETGRTSLSYDAIEDALKGHNGISEFAMKEKLSAREAVNRYSLVKIFSEIMGISA